MDTTRLLRRRRRRTERKVAALVAQYGEGRRLMRQGDGADEWIGMKIVTDALLRLTALGRDEHGCEVSTDALVRVLRRHGLRTEADGLADG